MSQLASSWVTAHLCVPFLLALCHRKGSGVAGDTVTVDIRANSCFCSWEEDTLSLCLLAFSLCSQGLVVTDLGDRTLLVCSRSLKCSFQWHLAGSAADKRYGPTQRVGYLIYGASDKVLPFSSDHRQDLKQLAGTCPF